MRRKEFEEVIYTQNRNLSSQIEEDLESLFQVLDETIDRAINENPNKNIVLNIQNFELYFYIYWTEKTWRNNNCWKKDYNPKNNLVFEHSKESNFTFVANFWADYETLFSHPKTLNRIEQYLNCRGWQSSFKCCSSFEDDYVRVIISYPRNTFWFDLFNKIKNFFNRE
jgi:hypothetical protein